MKRCVVLFALFAFSQCVCAEPITTIDQLSTDIQDGRPMRLVLKTADCDDAQLPEGTSVTFSIGKLNWMVKEHDGVVDLVSTSSSTLSFNSGTDAAGAPIVTPIYHISKYFFRKVDGEDSVKVTVHYTPVDARTMMPSVHGVHSSSEYVFSCTLGTGIKVIANDSH